MSVNEVYISGFEIEKSNKELVEVAINKGVPLKPNGESRDGYTVRRLIFSEKKGVYFRWHDVIKPKLEG